MPPTHRPYPAYKSSGVPWLGHTPAHWEVPRLKGYVTNAIDLTRASIDGELYLALEHVEGWTGRFSDAADGVSIGSQVKRFQAGDVLFGKLRPYLAKVTRPKRNGVCVGEFLVLRPHDAQLSPGYLEQLLRSKPAIDAIDSSTVGAKMPRAEWQFIGDLVFPLPPLPEQAAIVRYLDHVDRRIRRYVAAKRKLIALLEEERKKATYEAIQSLDTRSYRLEVVANLAARPIERASDETYTPVGLYNRGRGIFKKEPRSGNELGDSSFFWVEEGDLVISGQFAWEGAIALASDVEHGCVASHRYPILRGKPGISDSGFLLSFFQTAWGQLLLDHHSRGAAGRNRPLNIRTLLKEAISLPPLESQLRISEMLQRESYVRQQVRLSEQLLTEYRTRLIADVVTGKLDVREAAAQLPDEADEDDSIDEDRPLEDDMEGDLYGSDESAGEPVVEGEVTA